MIGLEYIKSDIQNIAEAIVSVLNIDVTIVNKELFRIAGTGVYIDKIGLLKNHLQNRLQY